MGDVGALALGGAIGFVALATKTELSLPVIAGVFVVELFSDVIQVGYYKITKRRIFLMAPIHHHFEKMGWPESRHRGALLDRFLLLRCSGPAAHLEGSLMQFRHPALLGKKVLVVGVGRSEWPQPACVWPAGPRSLSPTNSRPRR